MLKNIIFDIGNVLLTFNRDFLLSHFYQGKDYEFLKENLFLDWELLDEDKLSLEEYEENVKKRLPKNLHAPALAVLQNWEYYMSYTDGIQDLISELKQKGLKLYVLSNMTRHFIERDYKFPILKQFDGIVYSAPIGLVKPDEKIYRYILEKFNLEPKECLFIDDMKANLAEAARFGIKTFLFNNNVSELREYISTL